MKLLRVLCLTCCVSLVGCSALNPFSEPVSVIKPSTLKDFSPKLSVERDWSVDVGHSESGFFKPVLQNGGLYAASQKGHFYSVNPDTGALNWKIRVKEGLAAGVAVTTDTFAVIDSNNRLLAYDNQGQLKWQIRLESDVTAEPLGASSLILVRTIDYAISAYSADSGGLVWRYQRQLPALTLRSYNPVSIHNGRVYAGFPGGKLVGLDLNSGQLVWQGNLQPPSGTTEIERIADITGAPIYNFREICAGSFQGSVGCINALNGKTEWSKPFSAPVGGSIDDRYLIFPNELGVLTAFSRNGGETLWEIDSFVMRQPTTPVVFGRSVVIGDYQGYLHFIERDSGNTIARLRIGSSSFTSPVLALDGSTVIVQSRQGHLVKLTVQ